MALVEQIIEQYEYLSSWHVRVNILDNITSIIYNYESSFDDEPSQAALDMEITRLKEITQSRINMEANDMNLPVDEEKALEYLRMIKTDIITQIRDFPAVTLAQTQNYVDTTYPNSILKFDKLYEFYLNLLNLSTWDEFKTFVINHEFEGIG